MLEMIALACSHVVDARTGGGVCNAGGDLWRMLLQEGSLFAGWWQTAG